MEPKQLVAELRAMEIVQGRMREILTDVAYALKGPAKTSEPHSWADLADVAQKIATEHKHLKSWWQDHMDRVSASFEDVAVNLESVRKEAEVEGFKKGALAVIDRVQNRLKPLPEPDIVDPDEVI